MTDQKYSVTTADPSGYWLIPDGINDPAKWACMGSADPVEEIDDLRIKLENARAKLEDAELLAERRKWGAQEMDRLRAKLKEVERAVRECDTFEQLEARLFDALGIDAAREE